MIRKYHNHKLQTSSWHREEEPLNHHETRSSEMYKISTTKKFSKYETSAKFETDIVPPLMNKRPINIKNC